MSECEVIICEKDGKEIGLTAPAGALFLQLLKGNGYPLVCCNGKGGCGRCRLRFPDGDAPLPAPADRNALTAQELREGVRLACVHRVKKNCRIQVEFVHPRQVEAVTGFAETAVRPVVYGERASFLPEQNGCLTARKNDRLLSEPEKYVLALDMGTTTIAAEAVSLSSLQCADNGAVVLAQVGRMNPQRAWGSDVISRIEAAGRGEGEALRRAGEEAVVSLIMEIIEKAGRLPEKICLAGNTTMEHLLLGLDASGLGQYPFHPVSLSEQHMTLSLPFPAPSSPSVCGICLLPGISAFVGADILAGLLACGFADPVDDSCRLFIDLGTNGEMAIQKGGRLICTATAAGPAFEGGASANLPGTDMVALLARLLRENKIDHSGLLCEELFEAGWQEGKLRVTQNDIRSLQTAKAAVRAGVEILMRRLEVSCGDVQEVYLAGGFGLFLDVRSAAEIGLFPPALAGKVRAVGNTSLAGAALYGGRPGYPALAKELLARAEVINLAEESGFYEKYLENMEF